jgi:hypothetical protein
LFHVSEQQMAKAIPAKRIRIGMMMRNKSTGEELSSAVTGGISSRIEYWVNCSEDKNHHKYDESNETGTMIVGSGKPVQG